MATTTNYAWETPDDTDLVKDGAAAIRTLGSSIDTTTKALNPSTTLGDIEYRSSTSNTNTRLGIGTTGQVLTVAGGVPSWATPAGGGKVLQVVNVTYSTEFATSSSTYADTGLTATITPTLASSKILVLVTHFVAKTGQYTEGAIQLLRGASSILTIASSNLIYNGENINVRHSGVSVNYLDSPATTSATTYKTQAKSVGATSTFYTNISSSGFSTITLMEIGA